MSLASWIALQVRLHPMSQDGHEVLEGVTLGELRSWQSKQAAGGAELLGIHCDLGEAAQELIHANEREEALQAFVQAFLAMYSDESEPEFDHVASARVPDDAWAASGGLVRTPEPHNALVRRAKELRDG